MMKELRRKLESQTGESITETLVALLIAAFALLMLAGAITASSGVVTKSKESLKKYYSANDKVVTRDGGTTVTDGITITDEAGSTSITFPSFDIVYYENDKLNNTPVIAYNKNRTNAGA